ncbi:MAG: RES domain-containing protein [Solirubrobacteraceae bacterium]
MSLTPEGAWAELIRGERLRSTEALRLVSMPMWELQVHETNIADYSTFAKAEAADFPPRALIDEDYKRCKAEATRLRELGYHGVLAPSAALPGAVNLTLFGRRLAVPWGYPTAARMASFIPAKQLAVGRPPDGLLPMVCHSGERHSGLTEYLRESRALRGS